MASESVTNATLTVLLEHKLAALDTIAQTTMLWWTVGIVFSSASIGLIWMNQKEVASLAGRNKLYVIMTLFLISFPLYAGLIIVRTEHLKREAADLLMKLGVTTAPMGDFDTVMYAVFIGGVTFFIVLVVWLFMWRKLAVNSD